MSVYSLRAKTHRPYVSLPVTWEEISDALKSNDAESLFFTPEEAIERVEDAGDLFKPVLTKVQKFSGELQRYFKQQRSQRCSAALKPYA